METKDIYTNVLQKMNCPDSNSSRMCNIQLKLQEFMEKGLVVPTSKGLRLVRDVVQFHDANLSSSAKWVDSELLNMEKDFYEVEFTCPLPRSWPLCPRTRSRRV